MKFFNKKQISQDADRDWDILEKFLYGTSKTKNEEFEKNGYLIVRNIWDPKDLQEEIAEQLK
jgi:hypothetical protein